MGMGGHDNQLKFTSLFKMIYVLITKNTDEIIVELTFHSISRCNFFNFIIYDF
jgi:hypothetical protein